jgi:hypothetical protein
MPSIDLGLPTYVADLWWNYGFTEAKRRVTLQQVGADTVDASNYYGAILAAMNAIGGETVPPYIPMGHQVRATAHRRDIVDLPWGFPAFYGVRRV